MAKGTGGSLDEETLAKLEAFKNELAGQHVSQASSEKSAQEAKASKPASRKSAPKQGGSTARIESGMYSGTTGGVSWKLADSREFGPHAQLVLWPTNGEFGEMDLWDYAPWAHLSPKVVSVVVKPGVKARTLKSFLNGCSHLRHVALSSLDASSVKDMSNAFAGCASLTFLSLSSWKVPRASNLKGMFAGCRSLQMLYLSGWRLEKGIKAEGIFDSCESLTSLDLQDWEDSNALLLKKLAHGAADCEVQTSLKSEKQAGSKAADASELFDIASQDGSKRANYKASGDSVWSGRIGSVAWEIAKPGSGESPGRLTLRPAEGSSGMMGDWSGGYPPWHQNARAIKSVAVEAGVKAATLESAFEDCRQLESADLSKLDVSRVGSMERAFSGCRELKVANLSGWKTSNLVNFEDAFRGEDLERARIDVRGWDSAKSVRKLREVLSEDELQLGLVSDFENWEFSVPLDVVDYGKAGSLVWWLTGADYRRDPWHLYLGASRFLDGTRFSGGLLEDWAIAPWRKHAGSVRKITVGEGVKALSLAYAFSGFERLVHVDLRNLDVSKVKSLSNAFERCACLETVDLSAWDTGSVWVADDMFRGCSSLREISINAWNTSNLESMEAMFSGCAKLQALDISRWDTQSLDNCSRAFEGCRSLASLDLEGWDFGDMRDCAGMFDGCRSMRSLTLPLSKQSAPAILKDALSEVPPEVVEWLHEPPFYPGDKVNFGVMPQEGARPTPIEWTVLESSEAETKMLCSGVVDSCCSGVKSTGMSVEEYEALLTRHFNHFSFSELEKKNAAGEIKVSVPRVGTEIDLLNAVGPDAPPSPWALRRGVGADARGNARWLVYDEGKRSWGCALTIGSSRYGILSDSAEDYREAGLRPVITVPNLKEASSSYRCSYRDLMKKGFGDKFSVGETLLFGNYPQNGSSDPIEWVVADKADGKMLLVSKKVVDTERAANGYASLERWLSEDFFVKAFCAFCSKADGGSWLSNAAYEEDIAECDKYRSLVFPLTHTDYDYYKDIIGIPEASEYAVENGVRVEGGYADWRLFDTWYVGTGRTPKGVRPAIQVEIATGEIVPRVLPQDCDDLSFPYHRPFDGPDFDSAMSESILTQAGYTVRATSELTTAERQGILLDLIKRRVISRDSIIRHLRWCMGIHERHANACARWQEDIDYLRGLWRKD